MGVIIGILLLSFLVFIHELGHFIAAKRAGVRVETFSIGFGPKLFGFRYGETDYRFSAILFGGYVKMTGQEDFDVPGESLDDPKDFRRQSILKRIAIAFAGPLFNYLLALVVLSVLYATGIRETPNTTGVLVVGYIVDSSSAGRADIRVGDTLLLMAGKKVKTWEDALLEFAMHPGYPMELLIGRHGGRRHVTLVPDKIGREEMGWSGLYPMEKVVVGAVIKGSPAERAGLQVFDTLTMVNGEAIPAWDYFVDQIRLAEGRSVQVEVTRGTGRVPLTVTPAFSEEQKRFMIGIQRGDVLVRHRYSPLISIKKAFQHTGRDAVLIWKSLKGLVQSRISVKSMTGPVGIVHITGQVAKGGAEVLLLFLAMISVNLAVVNLFPFLIITDGGVIFFTLLEYVRRKPLSRKTQTFVQQGALLAILALTLLITFNDVFRLVGK
ncbi:MAG: RIP metalloprotease RseP [Elusimicrobia bacterium RIFOXYB2_FULL_49_7]|nr:MAG: RIP metalloprotease RseP [Elusimicrobia bacterium RIFOXYB2_FULL_49_7]